MKTPSRTALALVLPLLCLSFQACQDRSIDDYRRDKVQQALGEINQIAGAYSGQISFAKDGTQAGVLSISLRPATSVQSSQDNLTYEEHATVAGTIHYSGVSNASVSFSQGQYVPDDTGNSGTLNAFFNVDDPATEKPTRMYVAGRIESGHFTGVIYMDGYDTDGGTFDLLKDGPSTAQQDLASADSRLWERENTYVGTSSDGREDWTLGLSVSDQDTTPQQVFVSLFSPVRSVQVTWTFGVGGNNRLLFDNASIDQSAYPATLIGYTVVSSGSGTKLQVQLSCRAVSPGAEGSGWDCIIGGAGGLASHAIYKPASEGGSSKKGNS